MDLSTIIKRPIITEKSITLAGNYCYTFEVDKKANKNSIAAAVKEYFGVDVLKVKTAKAAGKRRRFGKMRQKKQLSDRKKAFVQVKAGQKIDLFEVEDKKGAK